MKPTGYIKQGHKPYWVVAGIMYYDEQRAQRAADEVAAMYRTGRNNGD